MRSARLPQQTREFLLHKCELERDDREDSRLLRPAAPLVHSAALPPSQRLAAPSTTRTDPAKSGEGSRSERDERPARSSSAGRWRAADESAVACRAASLGSLRSLESLHGAHSDFAAALFWRRATASLRCSAREFLSRNRFQPTLCCTTHFSFLGFELRPKENNYYLRLTFSSLQLIF